MTKRHGRLAEVTRRAVIKFIGQELRSEIRENQRVEQEGLPEELKALRPDMIFEQRDRSPRRREEREEEGEQKITKIIEFSCPYGCVSHNRDTWRRHTKRKERSMKNWRGP
jgi:hypothetical protein